MASLALDPGSVVRFLRALADEMEAERVTVRRIEHNDWRALGKQQLTVEWTDAEPS
jgi:hypothetical protein